MIKGAIFDMDGVLVHNVSQHTAAWQRLGLEMGREFAEEDIKRLFGKRNREILEGLIGHELNQEELARCGKRKEELYRLIMAPDLGPVAGLAEFLADLRAGGVRTAVATSGPKENVDFVLKGLRLEDAFDAIVTGLDAPRSKPDPGIFLLAAERLAVPTRNCVVFEDSPPGIAAAKGAGCICVALATTYDATELRRCDPDFVIADFREVKIGVLESLQPDAARP